VKTTLRGGTVLTEVLWTLFGLFVAADFSIFGQNWPCSNWKMENDSVNLTCRPLGCILQNWAMFSYESMKRKKITSFCNTAWPQYLLDFREK